MLLVNVVNSSTYGGNGVMVRKSNGGKCRYHVFCFCTTVLWRGRKITNIHWYFVPIRKTHVHGKQRKGLGD